MESDAQSLCSQDLYFPCRNEGTAGFGILCFMVSSDLLYPSGYGSKINSVRFCNHQKQIKYLIFLYMEIKSNCKFLRTLWPKFELNPLLKFEHFFTFVTF